MKIYIGLDIGGTKIMAASTDEEGNEINRIKTNTPISLNDGLQALNEIINDLSKDNEILGIGAAIGGPINAKEGVVSPLHQEEWRNVPLKQLMQEKWKCPFNVDVDTNVAAIGEYYYGKYNEKYFLYITLSTGMGGGFLIDGKVYHGLSHPEIAHQRIDYYCSAPEDRIYCECGAGKCLEALVSGNGIKRVYRKNPEQLLLSEWKEVAYNLGLGLRNISVILSPEIIVFGGGVSFGGGQSFINRVEIYMRSGLKIVDAPKLKLSCLGYDTALKGACFIAKEGLSSSR